MKMTPRHTVSDVKQEVFLQQIIYVKDSLGLDLLSS